MPPPPLLQVSRLARAMAHEVTNPLAGLLAVAEVLQEGAPLSGEKAAHYGRLIEETLGRLEGLTRDLRLVANLPLAARPIDLGDAVSRASAAAERPARLASDEPVEVLADAEALHQGLTRLLTAAPTGEVALSLSRPNRFVVQLSTGPLAAPAALAEVASRLEAAGGRVVASGAEGLTLRLALPLARAEV